ncbi:T9SS type A sorting domain-containing protein [Flavobacterium humidisoli]|uniref:T9SS type A sorting domain-containing protein n=1 Tax=Flavobacterium humidisoli TaxID=2937442 RepID=A0ABY4LXB3_9FLAO|nr:T9SS type A sorting domain-containing protein [Flavobacterium humidisoli]UPZ17704.1 T9SS type A sorting domain-containing protein [Flavobacterium humidisoli]
MKLRIFTFLFFLITTISNSQIPVAGKLDTNFGDLGSVFLPSEKASYPIGISIQPKTGEIITVGEYNIPSKSVGFIGRYDFYGNPKTDFGTNGIILTTDFIISSFYRVYFESEDPKSSFYVRGESKNIPIICKYFSNGALDKSYGSEGAIYGIKGQIHGDYIYSLQLNTATQHQSFKRYFLKDGTLDPSFNNGDLPFLNSETSFELNAYDNINIQPDGKILLCGKSGSGGIIARYDNLGYLDSSFGINGYYKTDPSSKIVSIRHTKTQSNGKIIFLNTDRSEGTISVLGRLNENGTLDTTFGTSGYFKYTFPFSGNFIDNMTIQSDDKIIFCGSIISNPNGNSFLFTARLSSSGALDFWRNDFESQYSDNWSLALVKDSYLYTFGHKSPDRNTFFPIIQKIFLKEPEISINGSSLPDNATDIVLSTTDGILYSIDNVVLSQGDIKFRLDKSDSLYWGKSESAPFLSGTSTMGAETIKIDTPGTYKINFNIKTGAYSLTSNTLGTEDLNNQKSKFIFYPNPSKEKITFNENLKSIKVYATDGKLININLVNNEINISSFPKGVYYFQVVTENDNIIGDKFIKE